MSGILEAYLWLAIGKNIRNNSGNCHVVGIDQIMMSLIELLKSCYQFVCLFFVVVVIVLLFFFFVCLFVLFVCLLFFVVVFFVVVLLLLFFDNPGSTTLL